MRPLRPHAPRTLRARRDAGGAAQEPAAARRWSTCSFSSPGRATRPATLAGRRDGDVSPARIAVSGSQRQRRSLPRARRTAAPRIVRLAPQGAPRDAPRSAHDRHPALDAAVGLSAAERGLSAFLALERETAAGHSDYVLGLRTKAEADRLGVYLYRGTAAPQKRGKRRARMAARTPPIPKRPRREKRRQSGAGRSAGRFFRLRPILVRWSPRIRGKRCSMAGSIWLSRSTKTEPFPDVAGPRPGHRLRTVLRPPIAASRDAFAGSKAA